MAAILSGAATIPPIPEFLDICERLDFVVIDDAFDKLILNK